MIWIRSLINLKKEENKHVNSTQLNLSAKRKRMKITSFDVGQRHLSICKIFVPEEKELIPPLQNIVDEYVGFPIEFDASWNFPPKVYVEQWQMVDLESIVTREAVTKLVEVLDGWNIDCDVLAIELQLGRTNPKMFAMSYAIQSTYQALCKAKYGRVPKVVFITSNRKVTVFQRYFDMKHSKQKIKEQKSPSVSRRYRKENAVHIIKKIVKHPDLCQTVFSLPKNKQYDMADSICIGLCYIFSQTKKPKVKKKKRITIEVSKRSKKRKLNKNRAMIIE